MILYIYCCFKVNTITKLPEKFNIHRAGIILDDSATNVHRYNKTTTRTEFSVYQSMKTSSPPYPINILKKRVISSDDKIIKTNNSILDIPDLL